VRFWNPGTDPNPNRSDNEFLMINRGLFQKASYLRRF
jgi:hypothetical protein